MIKSKLKAFIVHYHFNNKLIDLPYLPRIANIELTNGCNYHCRFCASNGNSKSILKKINRKKSFMKYADFSKLISKYSKLMDGVCISHHGESLLHPEFSKFVKLLHKKKINYSITTNGSLLNAEKARLLKKYPPKNIMFSVYTTNPKLYSKLCIGGEIKEVLNNIDYFLKIKNKKTQVIIRTLDIPYLQKHKTEFFEYFKDKGVSFDLNVLNSWGGRVDLREYDIKLNKHTVSEKYCIQPWAHIIIGSDLGVYICNNHEDKPIANLKKSTIEEVWNSEKYKKIRQNIISGDLKKNTICSSCDYFDNNTQLFAPTRTFIFKKEFVAKSLHLQKDLTKINK